MQDLRSAAVRQLADYDAHAPGKMFDGPSPVASEAEAYALQFEVARLRGERGEDLAGYKVGCVSEVIRRQLHMERALFGHIFGSEVHHSGATLDPRAFAKLAIEGEFAVRLTQDIPGIDLLRQHQHDVFASIFPVIELHNHVLRGADTALELIANNGLHAGVVLPAEPKTAVSNLDQILDEPIWVLKNGQMLGRATAGAVPGGPFESVCQLVSHLALHGIRLRKDQIILTGSPLALYPVEPGDRIEVRSGQFGEVSAAVLNRSQPSIRLR
jgi:2-keto-4-pentenoate hydratase